MSLDGFAPTNCFYPGAHGTLICLLIRWPCLLLQLELEKATEAKVKAEKEVEHLRMQLKSLESSYDALMAENMKQSGAKDSGDTLAFAQRRKAD